MLTTALLSVAIPTNHIPILSVYSYDYSSLTTVKHDYGFITVGAFVGDGIIYPTVKFVQKGVFIMTETEVIERMRRIGASTLFSLMNIPIFNTEPGESPCVRTMHFRKNNPCAQKSVRDK